MIAFKEKINSSFALSKSVCPNHFVPWKLGVSKDPQEGFTYFWNGSHAIPMQRVLILTKIIIPEKFKLGGIFANSLFLYTLLNLYSATKQQFRSYSIFLVLWLFLFTVWVFCFFYSVFWIRSNGPTRYQVTSYFSIFVKKLENIPRVLIDVFQ